MPHAPPLPPLRSLLPSMAATHHDHGHHAPSSPRPRYVVEAALCMSPPYLSWAATRAKPDVRRYHSAALCADLIICFGGGAGLECFAASPSVARREMASRSLMRSAKPLTSPIGTWWSVGLLGL